MGIREKILIPMLLAFLLFATILHFYWAPQQYQQNRKDFISQMHKELTAMHSDLIRNLLTQDYSALYASLDAQRQSNRKFWALFTLFDEKGNRIYPLFTEDDIYQNNVFYIPLKHELKLEGESLGHIEVYLNWQETYNRSKASIEELEIFLLCTAFLLILFTMYWQNKIIRLPLLNLKKATEKMINGNFNSKLPLISSDEIGNLTQSFETMRSELLAQTERLSTSEKRFVRIAQATPIGIFQVDITGKCIFVNRGYQKITKIKEGDALGADWSNYVYPDDKKKVLDEWVLSAEEKRPFVMNYRQLMPDSSFIWVRCKSEAEYGENNVVLSYFGTIQDITDEIKMEEIIRHTQKMTAIGELTGGIAHELNNMLGIILGNIEMLSNNLGEYPKLEKKTNTIIQTVNRGTELIKKLLSFSLKRNINNQQLNINTILLAFQDMIEKTLTPRIELQLTLAKDLWDVNLDLSDLENTIIHLCANAAEAIEGNGKVVINTCNKQLDSGEAELLGLELGEFVLLCITDNGCGLNPAIKERIFEPFYTTKGFESTGLGLSQVYGFMERTNGVISVHSEVSKGTSFTLYFPRYIDNGHVTQDRSFI